MSAQVVDPSRPAIRGRAGDVHGLIRRVGAVVARIGHGRWRFVDVHRYGSELDKLAPLVAEQVSVVPVVSLVRVMASHPLDDAIPDSGSLTLR